MLLGGTGGDFDEATGGFDDLSLTLSDALSGPVSLSSGDVGGAFDESLLLLPAYYLKPVAADLTLENPLNMCLGMPH